MVYVGVSNKAIMKYHKKYLRTSGRKTKRSVRVMDQMEKDKKKVMGPSPVLFLESNTTIYEHKFFLRINFRQLSIYMDVLNIFIR